MLIPLPLPLPHQVRVMMEPRKVLGTVDIPFAEVINGPGRHLQQEYMLQGIVLLESVFVLFVCSAHVGYALGWYVLGAVVRMLIYLLAAPLLAVSPFASLIPPRRLSVCMQVRASCASAT